MNVLVEEQNLQNIASAIREKNNSENTYKPSEMSAAIKEISTGLVDDLLWNNIALITFAFDSLAGNIEFNVPKNMKSLKEIFSGQPNVRTVVINKTDGTNIVNMFKAFFGTRYMTKITLNFDTSAVTNWDGAFNNSAVGGGTLITIEGLLDFSSSTNTLTGVFGGNRNIKNIQIKEQSINSSISFPLMSLLTDDSVNSIINGLADLSGSETAKTVTFDTVIKNKLTEEQIATINNKGWTLA